MSESNWAAQDNGARIADVSFEAANSPNRAANLLNAREDELWLAASAPQHVTLSLSPAHPPLQYAGWHVWLDSPTNPKIVEMASGRTLEQLRPLLVCEALPGAGTQVWRLPRAIPPDHTFVRFSILESFGAGPIYMNTLVLLETDPGPDYNAYNEAPPTTSVSLKAAGPQYTSPVAATPLMSSRLSSASGNVRAVAERSPLPRRATPPTRPPPPPAGINMSATTSRGGGRDSDDGTGRSDVGLFIKTSTLHGRGGGASAGSASNAGLANDPLQPADVPSRGRSAQTHTPRMRSNSRMSQLLRDLDDDIKLLKPIKSVSPRKNMLMYLPHENSGLEAESLDDRRTPDRRSGSESSRSSSRDGSSRNGADDNGGRGEAERDRDRRHGHRRTDREENDTGTSRSGDDNGVRNDNRHRQRRRPSHRGSSAASNQRDVHPARLDIALYPPPPPTTAPAPQQNPSAPAVAAPAPASQPAGPAVNPSYEARLNALERAVAALNEAVQHQRDDMTMIKRLLLQQATERRKEAEQRYEEKQRLERVFGPGSGVMVVPQHAAAPLPTPSASSAPAAAAPPVPAHAVTPAPPAFVPDGRLTHRSITVDFPEDALRVFVESVLEQRLRKHTKKVEAKLLQRLDKQLHDVIKVLSATVEGQLSNVTLNATAAATAAAAASLSSPPSLYVDPMHTSGTGNRLFSPVSPSSFVQGASRPDLGHPNSAISSSMLYSNGHATPHRNGAAPPPPPPSPPSSRAGLSHTPRSQTETGVGGPQPRVWSGKR